MAFVERDLNRTAILDPAMLELCAISFGDQILDVGCGEGRFCRMLAASGAVVSGIDPVNAFLRRAQSLDPVGSYVRSNAKSLPFPDESFDWVISYLTFIDIEDFSAAVK